MGNTLDEAKSEKDDGGSGSGILSAVGIGKQETLCGELSYKTRLIGWLVCSIVGMILSLLVSFVFVFTKFKVAPFAILYSLGQIISVTGSCFLSTPAGHCKDMMKKHRIIPSICYLVSIIATLVVAIATELRGLVFLFLIIQVLCYYWYTISFIPFGQKILKKACECCLDM